MIQAGVTLGATLLLHARADVTLFHAGVTLFHGVMTLFHAGVTLFHADVTLVHAGARLRPQALRRRLRWRW